MTLCDPIDGSPPGSSVPGILQARILEWVAVSFRLIQMVGRFTHSLSVIPLQITQKKCTKKDLHHPDNHNDVITNLEPDILECEVKWALEGITRNKASGGDGISVELFQILKDDAVKVLNMPANLENSAVATGLEKVSFHSKSKERQCQRMLKLPHNCTHLKH